MSDFEEQRDVDQPGADPFAGVPDIDERLADWVDGTMSAKDRGRFEAEMRVSPKLREEVAEYERTVDSVRAALGGVQGVEQLSAGGAESREAADRIMAALAARAAGSSVETDHHEPPEQGANVRGSRRSSWPLVWAAMSAAAVLSIAVLLDAWGGSTAPATRHDSSSAPLDSMSADSMSADSMLGDNGSADSGSAGFAKKGSGLVAEGVAPNGEVRPVAGVTEPGMDLQLGGGAGNEVGVGAAGGVSAGRKAEPDPMGAPAESAVPDRSGDAADSEEAKLLRLREDAKPEDAKEPAAAGESPRVRPGAQDRSSGSSDKPKSPDWKQNRTPAPSAPSPKNSAKEFLRNRSGDKRGGVAMRKRAPEQLPRTKAVQPEAVQPKNESEGAVAKGKPDSRQARSRGSRRGGASPNGPADAVPPRAPGGPGSPGPGGPAAGGPVTGGPAGPAAGGPAVGGSGRGSAGPGSAAPGSAGRGGRTRSRMSSGRGTRGEADLGPTAPSDVVAAYEYRLAAPIGDAPKKAASGAASPGAVAAEAVPEMMPMLMVTGPAADRLGAQPKASGRPDDDVVRPGKVPSQGSALLPLRVLYDAPAASDFYMGSARGAVGRAPMPSDGITEPIVLGGLRWSRVGPPAAPVARRKVGSKGAVPSAYEQQDWLIEGSRSDVAKLLQAVRQYADGRQLQCRSGEVAIENRTYRSLLERLSKSPKRSADTGVPAAKEKPAGGPDKLTGPGKSVGQPRSAPAQTKTEPRQRIVLRLRARRG